MDGVGKREGSAPLLTTRGSGARPPGSSGAVPRDHAYAPRTGGDDSIASFRGCLTGACIPCVRR